MPAWMPFEPDKDYKEPLFDEADKTMLGAVGIMCLPLLIMIFPPLLFIIIGGLCFYAFKK